MSQTKYSQIPGFEHVYLEDSYVLDIIDSVDTLKILLDVVLTESHPNYSPPKKDEQYCFRRGEILFERVQRIKRVSSSIKASYDANGEIDYGNIDTFYCEGSVYHINGSWGAIEIVSDLPHISIF